VAAQANHWPFRTFVKAPARFGADDLGRLAMALDLGAHPMEPIPPEAEPAGERDIRRTLKTMVLVTVGVLAAITIVVLATAPLRPSNHLYAAPSAPLAVADANASADKAKAAADRARAAAERAQAVTANKTAEP